MNQPPRYNQCLEGQSDAEAEFLNECSAKRLHHAWLICGPKGIGKATLAYRMSRYILVRGVHDTDENSLALDPVDNPPRQSKTIEKGTLFVDPDDPVFRRIAAGTHADFLYVERAEDQNSNKKRKDIVVADIRSVSAFLNKTPAEGGWRVVIIDSVDDMTVNAANALLKTLEAPPKHALLLLVSHNPGKLLPTIRSRCRPLRLKQLDSDSLNELIKRYVPEEKVEEASSIVRVADGSIGRVMMLLEEDGIEICQLVNKQLSNKQLSNIGGLDAGVIDKLGEVVVKDSTGENFRMLWVILNHWLADMVKTTMVSGVGNRGKISDWIDIWEETNNLFQMSESVNLDQRHVILKTFFAICAVARGNSRASLRMDV